jgi:F-type H+-transporting ATPase subunit delta
MRAASRVSYLAAVERLSAYAQGAQPSGTAEVADETLAVGRLLAREPRLRRALADSARAGEERSELLRTVLAGKISEDALDLLAALVGGRWSSAGDLLDAVERLGVDALLASAERAGELADVEDELFRFGQVVAGDPQLAAVLGDASADIQRRAALVHDLLASKAKPVTVRLAQLALAGFGGRGFQASLTRLVELAADRRNASVAYVTAAVLPSEEQERRLAARLSEMYGREVSLKITVDPRVIGGMRVRVGSDLFDGTVSRRLAEARHALAK